ncbi:5-bromo-4-chloroindolyl phosphate hydrolysis family protein [Luteococcus sp. H138]|uniref:5-bromo-4-chloroindolyl phosphate hydrolysis family protein n=1 Tax=unclassified Luteococcus TaxID=2639923 RepID=UPI00313DC1F3
MTRHSTLTALLVAALVFVAMFALLADATDLIRLFGPAVLAVMAAGGTKLMLQRSAAQISDEAYRDDAKGQMRACLDLVAQIRENASRARSNSLRNQVERMAQVVPELLRRVERTSPTSLYSSASQLRTHLESLDGVVRTFGDIEKNPAFYDRPQEQLVAGEQAVHRFVEFATDSIKLVNQGDLAAYQANLDTVAPPRMPTLEIPTSQNPMSQNPMTQAPTPSNPEEQP